MENLNEADSKIKQAFEHFKQELKKIRTGRASAQVLDGLLVEVYGSRTPLQHIANVIALDAQTLQITPFDPSNLNSISAAVREDQSLGLNPSDDGKVIRIPIPPLTEERRKQIVKTVHDKAETIRIAIRNIRHDVLKQIQLSQKNGGISEDELKSAEKELTKKIDTVQSEIDTEVKLKEKDIMTV
jgi:ribosome recycling factor